MERSDVTLHFEAPLGVLKHRMEGEVVPLERSVGRNNGHKHVFLLQGNERLLYCVQTIFLYFFFFFGPRLTIGDFHPRSCSFQVL